MYINEYCNLLPSNFREKNGANKVINNNSGAVNLCDVNVTYYKLRKNKFLHFGKKSEFSTIF